MLRVHFPESVTILHSRRVQTERRPPIRGLWLTLDGETTLTSDLRRRPVDTERENRDLARAESAVTLQMDE